MRGPLALLPWLALTAAVSCTAESPSTPPTPVSSTDASAPADPTPSEPWFVEDAVASGIDFVHRSGTDPSTRLYLPEIVCGGVALLDHDGDGDLDVYFVQGGRIGVPDAEQPPNRLYRNRGDGTFEDVTEAANAGARGYGMGCAANDFDGDGDVDIYVTNVGPNVLLSNDGDGTFTEVPSAGGAAGDGFGASAAFFDADGDRDLDLVVIDYVGWSRGSEIACYARRRTPDYCQPNNYQAPTSDHLYRNDGGVFVDVSSEVGIDGVFGNGLGVVTGDFDADGRPDFFVANDASVNHHWFGTEDGRFEERALSRGTAVNLAGRVEAGMGVATLDIDGDGALDLFLSHLSMESNTLYLRRGNTYEDATDRYGLGSSSLATTGFGLGFADFDLDGDLDLSVVNGKVMQTADSETRDDPYAEPNLLYEFDGNRFLEVSPRGGTATPIELTSRGSAYGDIDGDGDIDIVVVNRDAPPSLLRNLRADRSDRHWVMFDVREAGGTIAQHAAVTISVGGRSSTRIVDPHSSYCSSNDPRVHFGLGDAETLEGISVRWADGTVEEFAPLPVDRVHRLERGG